MKIRLLFILLICFLLTACVGSDVCNKHYTIIVPNAANGNSAYYYCDSYSYNDYGDLLLYGCLNHRGYSDTWNESHNVVVSDPSSVIIEDNYSVDN
jgi:hypothetical protein